jgi:hypothetical protein
MVKEEKKSKKDNEKGQRETERRKKWVNKGRETVWSDGPWWRTDSR